MIHRNRFLTSFVFFYCLLLILTACVPKVEADQAAEKAVNKAQRYVVEQAIVVPLYTPINFLPVSKRIKGVYFNELLVTPSFDNAYIEQ